MNFVVPGQPVAKGRPRAVRRGRGVRMYTPQRTVDYTQKAAAAARLAFDGNILTGPICVDVLALFKRPRRLMRRRDPAGLMPHDRKPDCDNVLKIVLDACTAAGIWRDDAQVCQQIMRKYYTARTGRPCVVVRVRQAPGATSYDRWLFGMSEAARLRGDRFDAPNDGAGA